MGPGVVRGGACGGGGGCAADVAGGGLGDDGVELRQLCLRLIPHHLCVCVCVCVCVCGGGVGGRAAGGGGGGGLHGCSQPSAVRGRNKVCC